MAQLSLTKLLLDFDKAWKIALLSIVISGMLSAYLSHILTGRALVGMLIGGLVASIVAYPVSYFIIQNQEKLRQQNKRLQCLNDELESYNRILAHDIKNKVSVISLSSYVLVKSIDANEKHYQHVTNINIASEDLKLLIEDLKQSRLTPQDNTIC